MKRTEKNGKNVPFFRKERKRTERTERSFEKNGCPTLGGHRVDIGWTQGGHRVDIGWTQGGQRVDIGWT